MAKRYFWLKLQSDFFDSKRIKKLRRMAGGDTYVIIYLKLQLMAMKKDGLIEYTKLEPTFAEEIALDLDESVDDVRVTMNYLLSCGLAEASDETAFYFPYSVENTGSETASAQRVREFRQRQTDNFGSEALHCNISVTERKSKRRDRDRDRVREEIEKRFSDSLSIKEARLFKEWMKKMEDSGQPISEDDQLSILDNLEQNFPRAEWLPAIRRSLSKNWRNVYSRKEDAQVGSWEEVPDDEETERIRRMTEEMKK